MYYGSNMTRFSHQPGKIQWGISLLMVAVVGWTIFIIGSFMHHEHKLAIMSAVLITAEVSFVAGVGLVGKTYYRRLKSSLMERLRRRL
jgi:uncharacterized membrane protein